METTGGNKFPQQPERQLTKETKLSQRNKQRFLFRTLPHQLLPYSLAQPTQRASSKLLSLAPCSTSPKFQISIIRNSQVRRWLICKPESMGMLGSRRCGVVHIAPLPVPVWRRIVPVIRPHFPPLVIACRSRSHLAGMDLTGSWAGEDQWSTPHPPTKGSIRSSPTAHTSWDAFPHPWTGQRWRPLSDPPPPPRVTSLSSTFRRPQSIKLQRPPFQGSPNSWPLRRSRERPRPSSCPLPGLVLKFLTKEWKWPPTSLGNRNMENKKCMWSRCSGEHKTSLRPYLLNCDLFLLFQWNRARRPSQGGYPHLQGLRSEDGGECRDAPLLPCRNGCIESPDPAEPRNHFFRYLRLGRRQQQAHAGIPIREHCGSHATERQHSWWHPLGDCGGAPYPHAPTLSDLPIHLLTSIDQGTTSTDAISKSTQTEFCRRDDNPQLNSHVSPLVWLWIEKS